MASCKCSRQNKDFISNVPDIVSDKILELLPIRDAARTSLLSKKWRRSWLSLRRLVFDDEFCEKYTDENDKCNWLECSNIISGILFQHNGPIHEFILYIPQDSDEAYVNIGQWLSFLSKNEVKRIKIDNWSNVMCISTYIYSCTELVYLELNCFALNPPPTDFNGFVKLQHLVLFNVDYTDDDVFSSLIAKCRMLSTLLLESWGTMYDIVIDAPSLETLTIDCPFESLAFRDVRNLKRLSVCLKKISGNVFTIDTVDSINLLASSCQLKCIKFGGRLCKFLGAGGIERSSPVAFNHLIKLSLTDLNLDDSRVLRYIFGVLETSPYIEELDIKVKRSKMVIQHKLDCNINLKMDHLLEVKINGITGTSAEIKLIEYLLAISSVLEKLLFKCGKLDTESELMLLRTLTGFPRLSPKARLVCLI